MANKSFDTSIRDALVKPGHGFASSQAFGGPVFHSCGNYSVKSDMLQKIKGLKMADAAFTAETDPDPNPAAPFVESLKNTGIILNARSVGILRWFRLQQKNFGIRV